MRTTPFSGCLPPLPTPPMQRNISLESLCTDPLTLRHALVLTNNDPTAYEVHWEDTGTGLSDTLTAPANKDTFFDIPEGDTPHHIVATSGPTTVETMHRRAHQCGGSIVVNKAVTGEGMPPTGPWVIVVKGSSFQADRLARRRSAGDLAMSRALPARVGGHRPDRRGL